MARAKDEHKRINSYLQSHGLAPLEEASGLCAQLGFLIEGHDEFREVINRCEPAERSTMYEALRSNLRFEPKPLDVYIAELGQIAEAKQLPTIAADGSLVPFKPAPEVRTGELAVAQEAMEDAAANVFVHLVCSECTREAKFPGCDKREAIALAGRNGWGINPATEKKYCPTCFKRRIAQ